MTRFGTLFMLCPQGYPSSLVSLLIPFHIEHSSMYHRRIGLDMGESSEGFTPFLSCLKDGNQR
uniref:Uncharacterized protein n=1 Tax=Utricularia reniformis TaxID=192314 RepID=A0A1Y0B244_9LAMI|nr:hypothetical protein AEK19_MT1230 [Utricularia reniformis]ART31443.1 hypothetical protein AEK19_MT1230 [Utricularia reniformis]